MNQLTTAADKSAENEALAIRFTESLGALLSLFQRAMHDAEEFWSPDKPPAVVLLGRVCKRRTFRMHDPILMG